MHNNDSKTVFGFWVYLMTDCVLFASLFVTYAVLHGNTFGGPGAAELFSLPFVLGETLILLTSSFTAGLAMLAASVIAGALWDSYGPAGTFLAGLGFALVALVGLFAVGNGLATEER